MTEISEYDWTILIAGQKAKRKARKMFQKKKNNKKDGDKMKAQNENRDNTFWLK